MSQAPGPLGAHTPDGGGQPRTHDGPPAVLRGRRHLAGASGLAAAGVVVTLLAGAWPSDPDAATPGPDRTQPAAGSLPLGGTGEPVPPPAAPPADDGEDVLPPVAVGEDVALQAGLMATVTAVDDVTVTPRGPGDVVGPGEVVTLALRNGSGAPVDLATLAVVATATDGTPAIPSDDPAAEPLTGTLAPGEEISGVYVFRVSEPGAALRVEIGVNTSSDVAVVDVP